MPSTETPEPRTARPTPLGAHTDKVQVSHSNQLGGYPRDDRHDPLKPGSAHFTSTWTPFHPPTLAPWKRLDHPIEPAGLLAAVRRTGKADVAHRTNAGESRIWSGAYFNAVFALSAISCCPTEARGTPAAAMASLRGQTLATRRSSEPRSREALRANPSLWYCLRGPK